VVSKISFGNVSAGDQGVVDSPAQSTSVADADQRICVDFGKGKGTMNMLATSQVEGAPLAGGWVKFDVVLSRIEHNGIEIGDQGIVMGPTNNANAKDAGDRVNVEFGVGKGRVNMLAASQVEGVMLAGGLVKGDVVVSKVDHMKVTIGDKGVVCGASTKPSAEDAAERVNVSFPGNGQFNFQVVTQVQGLPLAVGWMKGDKVLSKIKHGGVEIGDVGTVVGPSSNAQAEDADQRVCIAFGRERKRINMLVATQIDGAPQAGGWVKGDKVVSRLKYKDVEVGQQGVVLGPSLSAGAHDAHERVCVDFGPSGCMNMLAESHLKGDPLAGGWVKGDLVLSKIAHNALSKGDEGQVRGPSTNPSAADASDRVCVNFGKEKGNINMLATSQIKGVKLAGNYVKGDAVISKIKHREVDVGDKGIVVGPSSNPKAADADKRVCVDFGNAKGTLNMLASSQIEQPLPGGFAKGDQVVAKKAVQGVSIGDEGVVVGSSTAGDSSPSSRQIRVDFGGSKGTINVDAHGDISRSSKAPKHDADTKPAAKTQADINRMKAEGEVEITHYNRSIVHGPCLAALKVLNEDKVKVLFKASAPNYTVRRVEMVQNDRLKRNSSDMLDDLNDRSQGALAGIFSLSLPDDIEDVDRQAKAKLTSYIGRQFVTAEWAGPGSRFSNVVPAWHGAKEQVIKNIAKSGFAVSEVAEPAWYGTGRYCTLEAELACMHASTHPSPKPKNADGEWCVLLSAAIVGIAYPITPGKVDYPSGPEDPTKFKFYGKAFKAPCDTHVVGIDGKSHRCAAPEAAKYHEIVSSQDAQLLPLAIVWFTN